MSKAANWPGECIFRPTAYAVAEVKAQAQIAFEVTRHRSHFGSAAPDLSESRIRALIESLMPDDGVDLFEAWESAVIEAAWWRRLAIERSGGASVNSWVASLAKRVLVAGGEGCDALSPAPAPAPAPAGEGFEDALHALIQSRVDSSVQRLRELAGFTHKPFSEKEMTLLWAAHRFLVLDGIAASLQKWPVTSDPGLRPVEN